MSAKQLPARPSLDQLKHQAKELLQSARQGGAGARARFRVLPAFASLPEAALERAALALHDAQSVIAREHGFESWKALREEVEARSLEFGSALEQFLEAATDGRGERAERILALFPGDRDGECSRRAGAGRCGAGGVEAGGGPGSGAPCWWAARLAAAALCLPLGDGDSGWG
ncbi:MAG: hypothetical protein U0133_11790 [Gemmatimonadales bacterium]